MTDETLQQSSRRPFDLPWNYDRTELRADGVVHAIGLGLALVAVVFLLDLSPSNQPRDSKPHLF
jgi:predicted membrane channel-forming protein YqfA (hemolysin III family)